MQNSKSVRIEESVLNELHKRQLPRESISRLIARLLNNLEEATNSIENRPKALEEDNQ